ncbi:MAG: tetratricopeptide repeat-containing sensor histidine kinase [Cyclobacteriaceae bacterium]|nr:tetratricopeptide repeat-containing sensor histidine kinase [Cyclobacteriaceae bacterium]
MSTSINFDKGTGRAYWLLGVSNYYRGNIDSSQHLLEKALVYATKSNDIENIGKVLNSMANIANYYRRNRSHAIDLYYKSLDIREKTGDLFGAAITSNNIAYAFFQNNNLEKAFEYFHRSLNYRKKSGNMHTSATLFADLAEAWLSVGHYDSAKFYLDNGKAIGKANNDHFGLTNIYKNKVSYFLHFQQKDSTMFYLREGIRESRLAQNPDREVLFLILIARQLNIDKSYESSIDHAALAIEKNKKINRLDYQRDASEVMAKAYEGLKDFANAYKMLVLNKQLNDTLNQIYLTQEALSKEYEYNLKQIELLNENEKLLLNRKLEQQKWKVRYVTIIAAAFFIIAYFLLRSNKIRKKANAELQLKQLQIEEKNNEIAAQNDMLINQQKIINEINSGLETKVMQRTRELRETVKNLAQQNTSLEQFSFMVSHNLRAPIARMQGLVNLLNITGHHSEETSLMLKKLDESSAEVDGIIKDLTQIISIRKNHDALKEKIDIKETFEKIIAHFREEIDIYHIGIMIEICDNQSISTIRAFFESVISNLISNAIKYRDYERPLEIELTHQLKNELHIIKISDNGIGIDLSMGNDKKVFGLYRRFHTHVEGKGLGLYMVKTQLENMGGNISVKSIVGKGTIFTISLPELQ